MPISSAPIKPKSTWHRMLHLLDANGGTLYLSQLYKPRFGRVNHVINGTMPKITEFALNSGPAMRYENQAHRMGWVSVQKWRNRTWVTILPKGRAILAALDQGKRWDRVKETAV